MIRDLNPSIMDIRSFSSIRLGRHARQCWLIVLPYKRLKAMPVLRVGKAGTQGQRTASDCAHAQNLKESGCREAGHTKAVRQKTTIYMAIRSFVMPYEIPEPVPVIRIRVSEAKGKHTSATSCVSCSKQGNAMMPKKHQTSGARIERNNQTTYM